ncbi:MAG TPA: restriction endonuclease, SacI family [Puia sp.]
MDNERANELLNQAIASCDLSKFNLVNSEHKERISEIILGSHLTFRYLLITALLAKCTDPNIHMLSLQAGANLKGAYDARSLCHKVIVPIDKTKMEGRLGNSNEPFLNKPARFPTIDPNNPVRAGKDKILLNKLYCLLGELNELSSDYVEQAFQFAVIKILEREVKISERIDFPKLDVPFSRVYSILKKFITLSFEGQSAVAVTGAIMRLLYITATVIIHPANQSGSSKKGVGDIDILINHNKIYAVEVKDKTFTETDVWHALENVVKSGYNKLIFVEGVNSKTEVNRSQLINESENKGCELTFINLDKLLESFTSILGNSERQNLFETIFAILIEMRAKDELIKDFKRASSF